MLIKFIYAVAVIAFLTGNSFAGTIYNFASFRSSEPGWHDTDLKFSVEVSAAGVALSGNNLVSFLFRNNSDVDSVIKSIHFDDGTLLQIPGDTDIGNQSGTVEFDQVTNGTKGKIPGGAAIDWNSSTGFVARLDADNPGLNGLGIDVGESLAVSIELQTGLGLADTLAAMDLALLPGNRNRDIVGGLRIGLHVGSFGPNNDYSDSFVNVPDDEDNGPGSGFSSTPEPTSCLIWGMIGLTGLTARRKRSMAR